MDNNKTHEEWVDNVKLLACILVVLGHFYQSMVKSGIVADTAFYQWFNVTIYYFHVPLFFICSGYLFQKYSKVTSFDTWKRNVLKKLIALGIPYFVFSTITWFLKKAGTSSVNVQLGSLPDTLFVEPMPPYWYLYILFVIFLIVFTIVDNKGVIILSSFAVIAQVILFVGGHTDIYFIDNTMRYYFWFIVGMLIAYGVIQIKGKIIGFALLAAFVLLSVLAIIYGIYTYIWQFIMGLIACYAVITILYGSNYKFRVIEFLAQYTMPIFLMHTIFAAPVRIILVKLGIMNPVVHIVIGLIVSFICPIFAMMILEKLKPLDFIIYPGRYIKFKNKTKSNI